MLKCIRGSFGLRYLEFKNRLDRGEEFSVYLLEGEDAYFRENALSLLKERFISEPEVNAANFDGADFDAAELLSSLTAYPFMSRKRLTLIREFYPKPDFIKKWLKGFSENPPSDALFIISNEKPCETLKKFKSLCVVDCGKADANLIARWIKARCAAGGVFIDDKCAKTLGEYCLYDMSRVENETDKLIAFAGEGGTLGIEDIDANVSRGSEYKVYEMTEAIGKRKFADALEIVRDLLLKGETPQRLLGTLYNYFRRLLHVAIAEGSLSEIAERLGVKEYAARKIAEQSKMFKKRALKSAVDVLADSDYRIKSGMAEENEQFFIALFKIMTDNGSAC